MNVAEDSVPGAPAAGECPRGRAGQPAVGLGVRERVTRPVCFSVGFVLPIGIFPDASDAKFGVTCIPQMGAGQRDPPPLCGRRASWCKHFLMGGRVWQLPGPQHRLWPRWALVGVPTQCRPAPPATRRPRLFLWLADLFSRLLLGSSAGLLLPARQAKRKRCPEATGACGSGRLRGPARF